MAEGRNARCTSCLCWLFLFYPRFLTWPLIPLCSSDPSLCRSPETLLSSWSLLITTCFILQLPPFFLNLTLSHSWKNNCGAVSLYDLLQMKFRIYWSVGCTLCLNAETHRSMLLLNGYQLTQTLSTSANPPQFHLYPDWLAPITDIKLASFYCWN